MERNISKVVALCKQYKVKTLFVFGSVLTDKFHKDSDVDLLVDFNKNDIHDYFDNFFELKYALESVLGRKVDLVESGGIRNPYFFKQVEASKVRIYG